jgi:hypothetical protein
MSHSPRSAKKRSREGDRRRYAELIKGYDDLENDLRVYAESYIHELFTQDEARQLKDYLDSEFGQHATTTITEVPLPVDNIMGVGMLPVGGETDFYMLSETPDYPLSFSVWGHFDLSIAARAWFHDHQ